MIVNTHNPESCAVRSTADGEALAGAFDRFTEGAEELGITFEGTWVNHLAHEIFVLTDADNAHVIEELIVDSGLLGRSHTNVLPVIPTEEAGP